MLFWLLCATMTAAALYAVTRPLILPDSGNDAQDVAADLSVYRDQLNEVDADRARGLLGDDEAAAARTEVSRRLLARADRDVPSSGRVADGRHAARVFLGTAIVVPLVAMAFYLANGAPGLPGTSGSQSRSAPIADAGIAGLIAKVEERLQTHPEDGKGWDVIAPVYLRQGRFTDAAQAFRNAIRLLGESPSRIEGLGEASVLAANGVVTEDAKQAFERLLELEPGRPEARFWLALAKEQDGQLAQALADYQKLIADAPADAEWRSAVDERIKLLIARLEGKGQQPVPGPSAEDVAAASKLDPAARAQMIEQMVTGLAERLKTDGNDLAGWQRLLRAYAVLGQKDKGTEALAEARKVFSSDQAALSSLDTLARSLGFDS